MWKEIGGGGDYDPFLVTKNIAVGGKKRSIPRSRPKRVWGGGKKEK